jgi:hypothetical protein
VNQPFGLTVGMAVTTIVWLLALTVFVFALWFHRDTEKADRQERPAKPPGRAQEPRKPAPGLPLPDRPPTDGVDALRGSGPLPARDRPPPPTPRQWVETHPPPVPPQPDPAPATEQIRPDRRAAGRWGQGPGGVWGYQPPEETK